MSLQDARPSWNIQQPPEYHVMPRKFAFTATEELGELQLGGYDPASIANPMQTFPMAVSSSLRKLSPLPPPLHAAARHETPRPSRAVVGMRQWPRPRDWVAGWGGGAC